MKKIFLFAFALLACAACSDDDSLRFAGENTKIENGQLTGSNMHFLGTSTATAAGGTTFTDDEALFEFAGTTQKLVLYMQGTRFAAAMPALRMRLYDVPYTGQGNSVAFSLDEIVPQVYLPNEVGGGYSYQPIASYKLTEVSGSIDGIECRVAFSCDVPRLGAYRVEYVGKLLENY